MIGIVFVVMNDQELIDALTADTHFRQAGFRAHFITRILHIPARKISKRKNLFMLARVVVFFALASLAYIPSSWCLGMESWRLVEH